MIILSNKPKAIPSKVYKYKDKDYGGIKTYKIEDENYLTRWVIWKNGKDIVPSEIWDKCNLEFTQRNKNIELWSKIRFNKFSKTIIGRNLILDDYQTKGMKMMTVLKRGILNMGMGTGKTAVSIGWWTNFCNKSLLIVCPKNVIQEWQEQFKEFLNIEVKFIKKISEYKSSEELGVEEVGIAKVYVINYDIFRKQRSEVKKIDILIFDEVHRGAGLTSLTHKAMYDFSMRADRVYGLSGSIVGNHFQDVMGIFKTVDPLVYGIDERSHYDLFTKYILDSYDNPVIYEYKNWDLYSKKFHSISYTVKLEDVCEMPERRDEYVYCERDKYYQELLKKYVISAEGENIETGETEVKLFNVDRVLNMTLKLMQLCSGFIKDFEGNWIRLNTHKKDALNEWLKDKKDALNDNKRKIVIFYQFNIAGDDIEEVLKQNKFNYKRIDGRTSDKNKDLYKSLFKTKDFGDPEGCDVILINYGTGTEGMNFQKGTVMLFYDLTLEFRKRAQAERRIFRRGQFKDCLFVNFVTKNSKEVETIYKLSQIKNFQEYLNTIKNF